jgi:hypothetical protein
MISVPVGLSAVRYGIKDPDDVQNVMGAKHRLKAFENSVLKRTYELAGEEMTGA